MGNGNNRVLIKGRPTCATGGGEYIFAEKPCDLQQEDQEKIVRVAEIVKSQIHAPSKNIRRHKQIRVESALLILHQIHGLRQCPQ